MGMCVGGPAPELGRVGILVGANPDEISSRGIGRISRIRVMCNLRSGLSPRSGHVCAGFHSGGVRASRSGCGIALRGARVYSAFELPVSFSGSVVWVPLPTVGFAAPTPRYGWRLGCSAILGRPRALFQVRDPCGSPCFPSPLPLWGSASGRA